MLKIKEAKDTQQLACLASEIWHEYWVEILSKEQIDYMVDKFQSKQAIQRQIAVENYIYFYLEYNNQIAGYTGLSKKDSYFFLSKLYIKKDFRHLGLGTLTFEFIKNFAKENNYSKIVLTVNKYNQNTIMAYKKWNFKQIDSVITDIGNGFVMDDYIMEYKFTL